MMTQVKTMTENPYEAPLALTGPPKNSVSVQYRVFVGKSFSLRLTSSSYKNDTRSQAQQAIADEIGAENVIAITEHVESFGTFSVVVWYRAPNE